MKEKEIKALISEVIKDGTMCTEERIDTVFSIRSRHMSKDPSEQMKDDIVYYSSLIAMLLEENGPHIYDSQLLQLYILLAETYVEQEDYRQLKKLASDVLDLIRYEVTSWEAMAEPLPRIIDAVGESVYNHYLYELLLHYFRAALRNDKLSPDMKGHMRKMLKLRILLDDNFWHERLFDKDLQKAIARQFSSDELMRIIMHPEIGPLRKDPIEYSWEWENIYYDVQDTLNNRFANAPRHMGFCFLFWSAEQELLKNEYCIDWRTPSQMNPGVKFD